MRHILSVIVVAALLTVIVVDVISAGVKIGAARNHYTAPVTSISVALPSGMKSFPVELPQ
jgi:P pilus assembly chaperone PapD